MSLLDTQQLLQAGAALGAVLLLLWALTRWLERRGLAARPNARLGLGPVLALDARRRVAIIRCDGREALLLLGPAGDQFLGWLPQEGGA